MSSCSTWYSLMDRRGNVVVTLLFMMLLAAFGLALATHTDLHLKIVAARKGSRMEAAALEHALILELHRYREKLAASDMNLYPVPETDFFTEANFPATSAGGLRNRHEFRRLTLRDAGGFRIVRILDCIRTSREGGHAAGISRADVDLVTGDIPVEEFGLLVAHKNDGPADAFFAAHRVDYAGSQLPLVGDFAVDADATELLADALGIEIPDWRRIREEFDLEPSDDPIPRGVYLARDEDRIRAVFVEGDLEKLIFSVSDGRQSILFTQDGRGRELRYLPGLESVVWSGEGDASGARFEEKIVVHGSVLAVEQAGSAAFLAEARIELLACGRLVVRSGLESENLTSKKEKFPNVLLMTCGRDFFSRDAVAADVRIDVCGDAVVQAEVVSAGALVNGGAGVEITGSLLAHGIENAGRVRVDAKRGDFSLDNRTGLCDFKFLKNFRVHFIEEESHEE